MVINFIIVVIIYLIPCALRLCSLKNENKISRRIFVLSDIIPFF